MDDGCSPDHEMFSSSDPHFHEVDPNAEQFVQFVPHKNFMPKTTGSQAHLLSMQEQTLAKQYNSLN